MCLGINDKSASLQLFFPLLITARHEQLITHRCAPRAVPANPWARELRATVTVRPLPTTGWRSVEPKLLAVRSQHTVALGVPHRPWPLRSLSVRSATVCCFQSGGKWEFVFPVVVVVLLPRRDGPPVCLSVCVGRRGWCAEGRGREANPVAGSQTNPPATANHAQSRTPNNT